MTTTKPSVKKLLHVDIHPQEFTRLTYRVDIDPDVTLEDIEKPEFFSNIVNSHLKREGSRFPLLECVWKDDSKIAEYYVTAVAEGSAIVKLKGVVHFHSGEETVQTQVGEFDLKYKGRLQKWCIIRKSDGATINEGLENKETAQSVLNKHLSILGKAA